MGGHLNPDLSELPDPRWPSWTAVFRHWKRLDIPDVDIYPFKIGEHYPRLPWLDRYDSEPLVHGNPQYDTAYHICKILPSLPAGMNAAYKLLAYCREYSFFDFASAVLVPALSINRSVPSKWWHARAKSILPPHPTGTHGTEYSRNWQASHWKQLVNEAGSAWRTIAQDWAIVRIPDFMDRSAGEYLEYALYQNRVSEAQEWREYERLKEKFAHLD